jgi:hypothetical protein
MLAQPVGSYEQVLTMPADEALDFLAYYLDQKEIEAYEKSLNLWAVMTANASPEDRESCKPKKPVILQDVFGD